MTNKLVLENLRHRPLRTLLSTVAIGIQVTMVLTLVGLSRGMLNEQARRVRGVGADILVRAPSSSAIAFSTGMSEKIVGVLRQQPHVTAAAGILTQGTDLFNYVTGLDLEQFTKLNGGFRFVQGGPFQAPDDVLVDSLYASEHKLKLGQTITLLNLPWHLRGIFEPGMLARLVVPLAKLQDITASTNKVTLVYVKLDNPSLKDEVIAQLRDKFKDYRIYSSDEYTALYSVNSIPMLKQFIWVVIGLGVLVGFLVVFLSMYTAVLERTREIGVLKALGASPGYILNILLRETTLLAVVGSILGFVLSYGTRSLIQTLVPGTLVQAIVYDWWPITAAIALAGALLGAVYPGLKAARQDAIEALAYD